MKKTTVVSFTILFALFILSSCHKDDMGATVNVHVTNLLGDDVKGKTVYLFKDNMGVDAKPSDAKREAITDENGMAVFEMDLLDLKIFESKTYLYFGVFYEVPFLGITKLAGSSSVTVKRGDTKKVEVKIPL